MPKQNSTKISSIETAEKPRRVKRGRYHSFRLQKKLPQQASGQLPGAGRLFLQSVNLLLRNWRLFGLILLVYALVSLLAVQNISSPDDITVLQTSLLEMFSGQGGQALTSAALIIMLGANGSFNPSSYQFIWTIMGSLALIWALREAYAQRKVRARDAFYVGMYPMVVFILVLFVLALEMIPATFAGSIYNTLISNGIAASPVEQLLWAVVCTMVGLISVYLIGSTIFALYIACLPEMTPIKALKSARDLTRGRVSLVVRKLVFLLFVMLVAAGIILVPLVLYAPLAAIIGFFILNILGLALMHSYLYCLYRSLMQR